MKTFQERLKFIIDKLADGKHTVFAKKCGIPPGTFQAYVDSGTIPKVEQLSKIGSAYRINLNWLLLDIGEPFIQEEGETKTSEASKVVAIDAVVQILREAEEETGIILNPAQRQAVLPILRKALAEDRREVNKLIRSMFGGKGDEGSG